MSGGDDPGPLELMSPPAPRMRDRPADLPPVAFELPVTPPFEPPSGKRSLQDLVADANRLRRAVAASACVVVAWSIFEAPWEIDANSSTEEIAGVIFSKAMLGAIAAFALAGRKSARYLLLFVCLTSVLAIVPDLPAEFIHAPWLAFLSSVESLAKLATFAMLAWYLKLVSRIDALRAVAPTK
ncbi:hypothetical protein [Caballeronia sp. TF1N1]|uniref:hypothetical protein n=1 Tax=Caballeronia sp. TF1N1 TaxID=2878153 RepID=UPI001FD03F88|nr:hypothetical protein [Caballeronia sp. TF1N1]